MAMRTYCRTLFLLILISLVMGFGRRKTHKSRDECKKTIESTSVVYNPLTDPNATVVEQHCNCNFTEFGIVQKIPYLRACSVCDSIEINFSSVCIRCGMCIAIAEKINQTLLEVHEMMATNKWLDDPETVLLLRAICDHSFKAYGLREINGKRFISNDIPGSIFIATSADGLWGKKMRELCHYYLDVIGETHLYARWQQWCKEEKDSDDLETVLCRSMTGVLRDCRRMANIEKNHASPNTYGATIKITASFDEHN